MKRFFSLGLAIVVAACLFVMSAPTLGFAQVVPNSVDPYELAPQNVHLYPITIDARVPYQYLPPIFAPTPMWRGAMNADIVQSFTPHNYKAYEIEDSTALVAWGRMKGDKQLTLESANQQEFLILPPEALDDGSSFFAFHTEMRCIPKNESGELAEYLERELNTGNSRVASIADQLPVDVLMYNYDRVADVADIQVRMEDILAGGVLANADGLATMPWPVEDIYISYSGWRRNPHRIRSLGGYVPEWFTIEGKLLAIKHHDGNDYLMKVTFEGYNPWFPITTAQNAMRKMIALSFNEFIETPSYIDFEKPLAGKEWHRQGSGNMEPYDTRRRVGKGSAGQGTY